MSERGNSTHGRRMDDTMKHETLNLTRNAVSDPRVWRQPEPVADDTDSMEVQDAMGTFTEASTLQPEGDD
ncbi:MAG: hypothetical protein ABTA24_01875 [Arthrobacter sp.]